MPLPLLILVDGMNLAYRSYFAYHGLRASTGAPTGALYGFLRGVVDLLPLSSDIIVCWDDTQSWRKKLRPTYKANRHRDPNVRREVMQQVAWLSEAFACLGLREVKCPSCEADDVIAFLSGVGSYAGKRHVLVVSGDKDLYQVLSDWVEVLPKPGQKRPITRVMVEKQSGIPIGLWADYLALGGDTCDNIRPMRGVGPKTALQLVRAGVRPSVSHFSELEVRGLPEGLKTRCRKAWQEIRACYDMALLPEHVDDTRLPAEAKVVLKRAFSEAMTYRREIPDHGREQFIKFLGRFELIELLSMRNKFFRRAESVREDNEKPLRDRGGSSTAVLGASSHQCQGLVRPGRHGQRNGLSRGQGTAQI